MFKEFDVVEAVKPLSNKVEIGERGTIVYCYNENLFIVEFINEQGETLDCIDVFKEDIKLIFSAIVSD